MPLLKKGEFDDGFDISDHLPFPGEHGETGYPLLREMVIYRGFKSDSSPFMNVVLCSLLQGENSEDDVAIQ